MIQTPIRRRAFRTLCYGLVLALGAACSGTGAGQIPCRDTTNCPGDFPTCSAAGFCVNNAPAATIEVVSGDAQTGVVGNALAQSLVIRVLDTNGNAVPAFGVTWSVGTGAGQVSAGSSTTGPDGKASITATVGTIAGANSFTAAAAGLTGSPKTFTATGIADVATTLVLTGASATTAGDVQPFTLTAKDTHGNVATGYRGAVTFTSTDGAAALPTLYTFTAGDAGIHQFPVTLKTAGARSVTAGDGLLTITKPGITVDPASAAMLVVTGFSTPVIAGTPGTVTVTALDAFSNTATGYLGTVQITTDNPNRTLPLNHTFTAGDSGVNVFPVTLKGASSLSTFSIIATDTVTATITGSQTGIIVNPDVAVTLQVAGFPNPATAGTGGFVAVTALDAFGNTATGYLGTVQITSTGAATLPANHTYTVTDAGVHTFAVTLKTATSSSIIATDTVTGSITGNQSGILVNPGATAKLLVTGYTSPASADTSGSVTVTAQDANNNTTPAYTGTVQFTSPGQPNATLPTNYTFTGVGGDNGVHLFSSVHLTKASPPTFSITVTDNANAAITGNQSGITVNPGATSQLLVTGFPNPANADTGGSLTVTAADANGNTTPAYTGTVQFTSPGQPNPTLPAPYTFTGIGGDDGTHTFAGVVLKKASPPNYSITATDAVMATINGSQTGIVVNAGATTQLQVAGFPNPVFGGTPGSVTVTAQDANNNTTPLYGGNVELTSTNASTNLPVTHTFTGPDAGVHTFTGVILNATSANSSIDATDLGTPGINGSQMGIMVNAGPLVFGATATRISGGSRDGLIFIAGGSASTSTVSPLSNTWFYNPADSSLTAGPTLAFARYLHTATAVGVGKVLVAGGSPGAPAGFTELELCDLASATPSCAATGVTLTTPRCNAAAALVSATQVLIAGGDNCAGGPALRTWDLWDSLVPATPVSDNGVSNRLTVGRRQLTATVVGTGKVLLAGGSTTSATADLFTLDSTTPANSTVVATTGPMADKRLGHSATVLTSCPSPATGPCVLIAGGNVTPGKTWEIYDASANNFPLSTTTGGALARQFHAAAAFANGKVLIAGGTDGANALNTTEVFDPAATTLGFTSGLGLQLARFKTAAAYAPAQDVLVLVGGNAVGPSTEQVTTP